MMTSDTQNVFSTPFHSHPSPHRPRAGQAGRPLHHGAEGGHQDRQQGEALRIRSDEGEEPRNSASSLASIGTLISSVSISIGYRYTGYQCSDIQLYRYTDNLLIKMWHDFECASCAGTALSVEAVLLENSSKSQQ